MPVELKASLLLQRGDAMRIGAERIGLLSAIAEHGSISAAARARGTSFRAGWVTVQALNNLFDQPLVTSKAGGVHGGAASITPLGREVIAAFCELEVELAAVAQRLERRLGAVGEPWLDRLWAVGLRTSARNVIRGRVVTVASSAVSAEVVLKIGDGREMTSVITRRSADELRLQPDRPVLALIKSHSVLVAKGPGARTFADNQLPCQVVEREDDTISSEVRLRLGEMRTLSAVIPRESADELEITPGDEVTALIKASHVILATE